MDITWDNEAEAVLAGGHFRRLSFKPETFWVEVDPKDVKGGVIECAGSYACVFAKTRSGINGVRKGEWWVAAVPIPRRIKSPKSKDAYAQMLLDIVRIKFAGVTDA